MDGVAAYRRFQTQVMAWMHVVAYSDFMHLVTRNWGGHSALVASILPLISTNVLVVLSAEAEKFMFSSLCAVDAVPN